MEQNVEIETFSRKHFSTYKSWFQCDKLNKELGGIDQEWLRYILTDESGREYAILSGDQLLAVLGIILPKEDHPNFVISNIAVNPDLKRRGIGSLVLEKLYYLHPLVENQKYLAFVKKSNQEGQDFFMKNNWKIDPEASHTDDFLAFMKGKLHSISQNQ